MKKSLNIVAVTDVPSDVEFEIGDTPTLTVQGVITGVKDAMNYQQERVRKFDFDVTGVDVENFEPFTLADDETETDVIAEVNEKANIALSMAERQNRRARRRAALWGFASGMWPLVTYGLGIFVGYSLH